MVNRQDVATLGLIQPLVQGLERVVATATGRDAARAARATLDAYLAEPGTLRWLADEMPVGEGPKRGLWFDALGRFSIVLYSWEPGAQTPIHDHWCWGAVAVVDGREEEARYRRCGPGLAYRTGTYVWRPGDSTAFPAGPQGIHRVACAGSTPARSLHIYGGDLSKTDISSIDLTYHEVPAEPRPRRITGTR